MNNYVTAIRWWVVLPLVAALLEPYYELARRVCLSLHLTILAPMFYGMALLTFLVDLPAVLTAVALRERPFPTELSWFWLLLLPSLAFCAVLYALSLVFRQAWGLMESKGMADRFATAIVTVFFSLCCVCLLMAFGAAASVSADIFPHRLAAIPWFSISLFFATLAAIFAVLRWCDVTRNNI